MESQHRAVQESWDFIPAYALGEQQRGKRLILKPSCEQRRIGVSLPERLAKRQCGPYVMCPISLGI